MAYVGDTLAPLFKVDVGPVLRAIAAAAIDEWHDVTVKNTPVDTRNLRTSWYTTGPSRRRGRPGGGFEAHLCTDVDYAPHVEWGTGLYGKKGRKYAIRAKGGGYLHFKVGGRDVFVREVMHPGSPGQHMLAIGAAVAEDRLEAISEPILQAWVSSLERLGS